MIKSMMLCSFLSLAAYSQYGRSYTVMDDYYQRNIQIEDTGSSVNQKINNPGLYKNSNSRSGIGFLQSLYDYKNSYELDDQSIGFDDLYAWTELNTDIGNFGGYVGNVSLNTNSNENNLNLDSKKQNGSLSAAIWFNPAKKMFFKGLSISADEEYLYNRSNTVGLENSTNNKTEEKSLKIN
ncbi:MAG TPA: hypothetical protein VHP36_00410, partial [Chitinispirillaceae bacterium]|nr:hypothetical protein [Chitinispirillaceae bacterium]